MITNEMLSAYIDGELAPEEMERVARAIAADELLAARLVQFRRVDRLLTEFSSAIDAQPLPPAVLALLEPPCADAGVPARSSTRATVRHPVSRRLSAPGRSCLPAPCIMCWKTCVATKRSRWRAAPASRSPRC